MSEVGLVPFARVALEVSQEVVPVYSHRFSPQRFTQPQLLAILCLMRYVVGELPEVGACFQASGIAEH